jgi:hypothetical protein
MLRSYRAGVALSIVLGTSALALAAPGCGGDSGGLGPEEDTGFDETGDSAVVVDSARDSVVDSRETAIDSGIDTADTRETAIDSGIDTADTRETAIDSGIDTADTRETAVDSGVDTSDTLLPDTLVPDTLVPDTLVPDTLVPDTLVPDTLDGAPPPFCYDASNTWCVQTSPTIETLWDVWGSGSNNVYAVGNKNTLLNFNGTAWSKGSVPLVAANYDLFAIWGSGATDIYIAGNKFPTAADPTSDAKIFHWNGAWSVAATFPAGTFIGDIDGSSATDIWAEGSAGAMMHFDGAWSTVTGFTNDFNTNAAISATNNWAFGADGSIRNWNGTTWSSVTSPTTDSIFIPDFSGASNIYAPLFTGGIIHYDGASWSNVTLPAGIPGNMLSAVWLSSATNAWVVGEKGTILQGNAASGFTVVAAPNTGHLNLTSLTGFGGTDIWAVGAGGLLLHHAP